MQILTPTDGARTFIPIVITSMVTSNNHVARRFGAGDGVLRGRRRPVMVETVTATLGNTSAKPVLLSESPRRKILWIPRNRWGSAMLFFAVIIVVSFLLFFTGGTGRRCFVRWRGRRRVRGFPPSGYHAVPYSGSYSSAGRLITGNHGTPFQRINRLSLPVLRL